MKSPVALNSERRLARAGFTLVELLVVIAIIAILTALTTAAVQRARDVGKRTQTVTELNDLDMACSKFKTDFGTNVPSRFRFPTHVPPYNVGKTPQQTIEEEAGFRLFKAMFRAFASGQAAGTPLPAISFHGEVMNNGAVGQLIDGSQCLVFFLGGPNGQGFTPTGPFDAGTNTSRKDPYFEFLDSRLDRNMEPRPVAADGRRFLHGYLDPYGIPYAFFSTGATEDYLPAPWNPPYDLSFNVAPLRFQATKPVNQGRVQIISAGKNKRFGPGGLWSAGTMPYVLDGSDGGDDLGNFNGGLPLGTPNL